MLLMLLMSNPLCPMASRSGRPGKASERVTGIEPAPSAWEAEVLPLNYTRLLESPTDDPTKPDYAYCENAVATPLGLGRLLSHACCFLIATLEQLSLMDE